MNRGMKTLLYIIFGAFPATLFGLPSLLMLLSLNTKVILFVFAVVIATAGLWMASFDTSQVYSKKRYLIISFLIIGLTLAAPIAYTFVSGVFTEPSGYMRDNSIMLYFTVGPVVIATHYIVTSFINIASNKSLKQTD